jgi:hypothetical protein
MKIVLPKPEHTLKKNIFPEPSPAACGSRKVMELAAAKVLAAVGNNNISNDNHIDNNNINNIKNKAKALDIFSGRATPPPPSLPPTKTKMDISRNSDTIANSRLIGTKRAAPVQSRLQIVNPETLGVINDTNKNNKKRRNISKEPTTPWDGELEALGR